MVIFALIAVFLLIFIANELWWKRRNYPPGPTPFPFLGNISTFNAHEPGYDAFTKIAEEYGPLYTFWIGPLPFIIVTDYNLMVEMFVKDGQSYTGRVRFHINDIMRAAMKGFTSHGETIFTDGSHGVIDTEGEQWQIHRRFTLHFLRDFGLGKNLMEKRVLDEVSFFINHLRQKSGQAVDLKNYFDSAVGSVINALLFGFRYDEDQMSDFIRLKWHLNRILAKPIVGLLMSAYPLLGETLLRNYRDQMVGDMSILRAMFREQIEAHKKRLDFTNDDVNDFTDAFLKEREKRKADGSEEMFSYIQLEIMCFDLWVAGMETTSNTLYWGVLYVLRDDEVQRRLHAELNDVIGSDRLVTIDDRKDLHYVNATIAEIQRVANLLPLNAMHKTTRDVIVRGLSIKAGTAVIPQICAALYDEKVFPSPYHFNPLRHLDEKGHFVRIEQNIPFSLGKRACLGEGLARMELFLFLSSFFNQFKIEPVDPKCIPTDRKRFGVTMKAINYEIVLRNRY